MRIAVGGKHLEHAVGNFQNGNVERTAAEIVNHHLTALVFIKTVRKRRRRRFVYDTKHVKPSDLACVFRRLTLRIGEVCGARNHRFGDFLPEIRFRIRFQFRKNHCGNFLRRISFSVNIHFIIRTHMTLDRNHRPVRICHCLTFRRLTYHTGSVFLERYHGRGSTRTLRVGDYNGFAAFHHRHTRISSTEVDTNYFSCHNISRSFCLTEFIFPASDVSRTIRPIFRSESVSFRPPPYSGNFFYNLYVTDEPSA